MTQHGDLKKLVRERMARTGENYTTALAALRARQPQHAPYRATPVSVTAPSSTAGSSDAGSSDAGREQHRLVERWFVDGRLRDIPARNKVRAAVLLEVLRRFEPGRTYPEREVSDLLREVHPDFASLRRELIMQGYLTRADGLYRVADAAPSRTPAERAELPAWEAEWLPGFLTGAHR